jgi:hypothetical protein
VKLAIAGHRDHELEEEEEEEEEKIQSGALQNYKQGERETSRS